MSALSTLLCSPNQSSLFNSLIVTRFLKGVQVNTICDSSVEPQLGSHFPRVLRLSQGPTVLSTAHQKYISHSNKFSLSLRWITSTICSATVFHLRPGQASSRPFFHIEHSITLPAFFIPPHPPKDKETSSGLKESPEALHWSYQLT